jgi:hypothetical protein
MQAFLKTKEGGRNIHSAKNNSHLSPTLALCQAGHQSS